MSISKLTDGDSPVAKLLGRRPLDRPVRVDVVLGVCAGDALLPRPGAVLDVVRVQPDGAVHVHQLHGRSARHLEEIY